MIIIGRVAVITFFAPTVTFSDFTCVFPYNKAQKFEPVIPPDKINVNGTLKSPSFHYVPWLKLDLKEIFSSFWRSV